MGIPWYKIKSKYKRNRYFLHTISAGIVFFGVLYVLAVNFGISVCPISAFFGKRCFGCGMTNGFIAMLNLDIESAFAYNVLSVPLFFSVVIYVILGIIDIFFDTECIKKAENLLSKKYMFVLYLFLLIIGGFINGVFKDL